jgi:hypothetical protein
MGGAFTGNVYVFYACRFRLCFNDLSDVGTSENSKKKSDQHGPHQKTGWTRYFLKVHSSYFSYDTRRVIRFDKSGESLVSNGEKKKNLRLNANPNYAIK